MRRAILLAILLGLPVKSQAVVYWLSQTGGTTASSCATSSGTADPNVYQRTMAGGIGCLAKAGDVLKVKNGTYTDGIVSVTNKSGVAGNPIIIEAVNPRQPVWRLSGSLGLNFQNSSYWTVRGLVFDGIAGLNNLTGGDVKTTLPVPYTETLMSVSYSDGTNTTTKNATSAKFITLDNVVMRYASYLAVQICEWCTDFAIRNSEVYNIGNVEVAGTIYGGAPNITAENNYFHDLNSTSVNFWNQSSTSVHNGLFRNNKLERVGLWWDVTSNNGTRHQEVSPRKVQGTWNTRYGAGISVTKGSGTKVYNNVIINTISPIYTGYLASNCLIANNSIYGNPVGTDYGNAVGGISLTSLGGGTSNCTVRNNIVYQPGVTIVPPIYDAGTGTVKTNNLCSSAAAGCTTVGNPNYKNVAGGDLHVPAGNLPCGAGISLSTTFTTDIEGVTRTDPWSQGAYVCTVPTPPPNPLPGSIMATWTCDAGVGTTVPSTVGNHPGLFTPNAAYGPGAIGPFSCSFDGTRRVEVTSIAGFNSENAKALSAWIKMSTTPPQGCDVASDRDVFGLNVNLNGSLSGFLYNGSSWPNVTGGTGLLDDRWHHILLSWDGANQRAYIDNANVATLATSGPISYTLGTKFVIGAHGNGQTHRTCTGLIDEVVVLDGYCTPECVENFYLQRVPKPGWFTPHQGWYAAAAPEGVKIGELDTQLPHEINKPIEFRWEVCNGGTTPSTEYFIPYCRARSSTGAVLVDWTPIKNTFDLLGVRFFVDPAVALGQVTSTLMPTDGFTPVPGKFIEGPADTDAPYPTTQQIAVAPGQCAELAARVEFGPPRVPGEFVECRPQNENGDPFSSYLGGAP